MKQDQIIKAYEAAKARYAETGVDTDAALADARYFVSQLLPALAAPFEQRLGAVVAPSQGELAAGRIEAYLAQMDGYAVTVQRDLPAAE